jgi:hypothetical protein
MMLILAIIFGAASAAAGAYLLAGLFFTLAFFRFASGLMGIFLMVFVVFLLLWLL